MEATVADRRAGVNERNFQPWASRLFENETNKVNRPKSQLQDEHKQHLIEFFDENSQATRNNSSESLTKVFEGFSLKETSVGNFILNECNLPVKRITRHSAARIAEKNLIKRLK